MERRVRERRRITVGAEHVFQRSDVYFEAFVGEEEAVRLEHVDLVIDPQHGSPRWRCVGSRSRGHWSNVVRVKMFAEWRISRRFRECRRSRSFRRTPFAQWSLPFEPLHNARRDSRLAVNAK